MIKRPIAIGLAPNLEKKDAWSALMSLGAIVSYNSGSASPHLESWLEKYYKAEGAYTFSTGRGALFAILTSLGVKKGDEVLVQAFTCVAVIDAIRATGARPIFVDTNTHFCMSATDAKRKKTPRAKVLLLQHTFGISAITEEILRFVEEEKLLLIEDCAHIIGGMHKKRLLGTFGVASIVSFGRDKAFSCVSGGAAICHDNVLAKKMKTYYDGLSFPSYFWTFQQLFHMVSFYYCILPLYTTFSIGKVFLIFFQKVGLLTLPVSKNDTSFRINLHKLPSVLSKAALLQLERLDTFNQKRLSIEKRYAQILKKEKYQDSIPTTTPLLRFPMLTEYPAEMKKFFKKHGHIYIGDWYSNVIDPKGVDLAKFGYTKGTCPQAEYQAAHIINLPTYPTLSSTDINAVCMLLSHYVSSNRDKK